MPAAASMRPSFSDAATDRVPTRTARPSDVISATRETTACQRSSALTKTRSPNMRRTQADVSVSEWC